jgi:hypothetical protein
MPAPPEPAFGLPPPVPGVVTGSAGSHARKLTSSGMAHTNGRALSAVQVIDFDNGTSE